MADRIIFRHDTKENWTRVNPILMQGEEGIEDDTKLRKLGDGINTWNNLDYIATENVENALGNSETVAISQKAVTNNVGFNDYEEFSDAKKYHIGDIVIKDGYLKEFIAEHPIGVWIGTDTKNISLKKIQDEKLTELSSHEIININALHDSTTEYTLEQAIDLVPETQRSLGTKIRFRSSTTTQRFTEATYIAADVSEENWNNKNFWFTYEFGLIPRTRWFALGDSITQGFYSKDRKLIGITTYNYPYYVGIINNYEVTNYGVGGSGYVHNATVDDKLNAKDKVDTIDFSECDLATLAWGINDWHYNCEIGDISSSRKGDGTMVGNMIYCIEKILTDNPKCKIIVILPQNVSAFGGNIESNWGLGTSLETSGTLQNVIDAQISVCEYYGIQYIDQTKSGIVNRFNIKLLLPDGLHPAEDGYINMARYISKQIQYA